VVRSGAISPDPEIGAAIFRASAPVEELLRDQITNSTQKINHSAEQESPLANLVLDACRDYWDVDVALINSGALRGSLGPGVITLADLYKSLPFEGTVVLAKITGSLLVEVLKKSGKFWGDPQRNNGFLQVSGLTARFFQINSNLSLDIDSIRVGGKALEMDKEYTLAVERYLFSGGDGYDEFSKAEIISDTMVSSLSVLLQTLRGRSVIDPVSDGRIVIE
jgi:2',3'-cyclic-nucleotide 2'-phosphodiesterase (5'-nucleotidase family)